jgi:hypothetical protein
MMVNMKVCHFCGQKIDDNLAIYRSTLCPFCGKDLKICLNCEFYSPGVHWDCRESITDPVAEKDKANFCDYFCFKKSADFGLGTETEKKAKEDFFKLFGNE